MVRPPSLDRSGTRPWGVRHVRPVVRAAIGLAVWLSVVAGCTYAPTQALIVIDTDLPSSRAASLFVEVRLPSAMAGSIVRASRTAGGAGTLRFPASMGVVPPADGPRDGDVLVQIEVVADATGTEPAVRLRRTVTFRFTPRFAGVVRVFLPVSCAAASTGCRSVPDADCTTVVRCEELGMTCGDRGDCIPRTALLQPVPAEGGVSDGPRHDATGGDGSPTDMPVVGMPDGTVSTDVRSTDVSSTPDTTPVDVTAPDVPGCMPNCSGRSCGPNGCSGSCGSCPSGENCNGSGQCVCSPNCGGRSCGANGCGGSCGSCPGGQSCNGSGQCVCVANCSGRVCGSDGCSGSCGACTTTNYVCNGSGQCVCGTRVCDGRCCPAGTILCGGTGGSACCDGVTCNPGCPC